MKKLFFILYVFVFSFLFVTPLSAHAQGTEWGGCVDANGVASIACLPIIFSNLINAALIFLSSVALILFIYAGILFVRSGGDPKQVQTARATITYAIIGLVLVLSSYGIITIISYTTGAKCIEVISLGNCK
ncbi:MAG: hypothetical protein ACREHC_05980 [Candidatus Levyibacteriota bacterium]